jgi:hypothetical protein
LKRGDVVFFPEPLRVDAGRDFREEPPFFAIGR